MKSLFDPVTDVPYHAIDLPNGTRLHFISCHEAHPDLYSVSVSVGFGGVHLACINEAGKLFEFPKGIAHFMEHFLMWVSIDDWRNLQYQHVADVNAVVTCDRTIWYAKDAVIKGPKAEALCDIVTKLILPLINEKEENLVKKKIAHTKGDVEAEILHRHSNLNYRIQISLLAALYHNNPIRYDMLGDKASVRSIQSSHVERAWELIRNNILSVTILGQKITDNIIAKVKATALKLLEGERIGAKLQVAPEAAEPLKVSARFKGIRFNAGGDVAYTLLGVKLLPLQNIPLSQDELKRRYLLNYLAMNHIWKPLAGMLSKSARIYLANGQVNDALFFSDEEKCSKTIKDLQVGLLSSLELYRENFIKHTWITYHKILANPYSLMRMSHAADNFGYQLIEFLQAFELLQSSDLDTLIEEINEAQDNVSLAYASSYAGLFQPVM